MSIIKVMLGVLFAILIFFIGCSYFLSETAYNISEEIEKEEQEAKEMYGKIKVGMTKNEVKEAIGDPKNIHKSESEYHESECWYYSFVLYICFDEKGKVDSKSN